MKSVLKIVASLTFFGIVLTLNPQMKVNEALAGCPHTEPATYDDMSIGVVYFPVSCSGGTIYVGCEAYACVSGSVLCYCEDFDDCSGWGGCPQE